MYRALSSCIVRIQLGGQWGSKNADQPPVHVKEPLGKISAKGTLVAKMSDQSIFCPIPKQKILAAVQPKVFLPTQPPTPNLQTNL